ncbi:PIN domain-containing protein [Brevibacillus reuszeri]|uniref:PIN domain-containing protein n=1 Tax=Brevibacillus reuszeri TaxID=54915 RepID=UPI000CCC0084|nr:PIN domain-containing protein [Brevibacillus reuszeri]
MSHTYTFEQFQEMWRSKPLIILDTSSILNIYKYSPETTENILSLLEELIDQLWIPNQVLQEFRENKNGVIKGQRGKFNEVTLEVERIIKKAKNDISTQFMRFSNFKFPRVNELGTKIHDSLDSILHESEKFQTEIIEESNKNKKMLSEDKVNLFVEELIQKGRMGSPFGISTLLNIYTEGEQRYKYHIPPGYMDHDKKETTSRRQYGDLVLWKQLLVQARNCKQPVIFITSDLKEDWWQLDKNQAPIAPRDELVYEFKEYSDQLFTIMTLNDFVNHLSYYTDMVIELTTNIEMNSESICLDLIEHKGWDVNLDKSGRLTSYLIQNGDLQDFMAEALSDVEILEILDPVLDIADVSNEGEQFEITGTFACKVTIDVTQAYTRDSYQMTVLVEGNFSCEFKVDVSMGVNGILSDSANITVGGFSLAEVEEDEYGDEQESDRCIACGNKNAPYFLKNGDQVCDRCSGHYDTCPGCGNLFESGTMGGAFCNNCTVNQS